MPEYEICSGAGSALNLPNPKQFSINGQRTGSNYFTIDRVSANFGSTASVTLYETAGGVPSLSALGTTSSLVLVDAVQEFKVTSSTYPAEFGRRPGGQITILARSGSNSFHANAFDYVRNDKFDAANFFDKGNGFARQPMRYKSAGCARFNCRPNYGFKNARFKSLVFKRQTKRVNEGRSQRALSATNHNGFVDKA